MNFKYFINSTMFFIYTSFNVRKKEANNFANKLNLFIYIQTSTQSERKEMGKTCAATKFNRSCE